MAARHDDDGSGPFDDQTRDAMKRMVLFGQEPAKPRSSSRFQKGQSGNPKGRPKKAKPDELSFDDQSLMKAVLDVINQLVNVREGDQVRAVSGLQALLQAVKVAALKGNSHSQALLLKFYERADQLQTAERRAFAEKMRQYKEVTERRIEEAKTKGLPEPTILPHPHDIVVEPNGNVRFPGPINEEELASLQDTLAVRDQLIWQQALEDRLGDDGESASRQRQPSPEERPGLALVLAMLLDDTVPARFSRADAGLIVLLMRAKHTSKRELLRKVREGWKALGRDVRRGWRMPKLELLFEALEMSAEDIRGWQ